MILIIKADHQWDKLGDGYLHNRETKIIISDDCNKDYLEVCLDPGPGGVFFVKKSDLKKIAEVF